MERLHIAFFGPVNSGKSTLVNAICGQEVSLVSEVPGTTTDPVRKTVELPGLGPCVLIDTAGLDDTGVLGPERMRRTLAILDEADVAVLVEMAGPTGHDVIPHLTCHDVIPDLISNNVIPDLIGDLEKTGIPVVVYRRGESVASLLERIAAVRPSEEERFLTGDLVKAGDCVLLVMPQDSEAPKGRLILPQVQVLRELLDRGCNPICATPASLPDALSSLKENPSLVITDSQVFKLVSDSIPAAVPLTSFSILLAGEKGNLQVFMEGAGAIDSLKPGDRVLIAEACTHVPDTEDIGRVKIPALLRQRMADQVGHDVSPGLTGSLTIDIAAGNDFPEDLSPYSLIIHCGACVATRTLVQRRIKKALRAGVPITNYGIALAKLKGILDRVEIPGRSRE